MAVYRQVQITFWQDEFVLNLTPEEKFFYLYLMTNSKTTQCGIYELPKRVVEFETGYNAETVDKLLQRFIEYGKILYNDETKEIMILNWIKYNGSSSPKVIKCIEKELKSVKTLAYVDTFNRLSIEYGYSMDTQPQKEKEKEEEEEKEKEEEEKDMPSDFSKQVKEIITYLNEKIGTAYRPSSRKTRELIKARFNEKFTVDDFKKVIDNKVADWNREPEKGEKDMRPYLRPETLFGTKFESYLNSKPAAKATARRNNFGQRNYDDDFYKKLQKMTPAR